MNFHFKSAVDLFMAISYTIKINFEDKGWLFEINFTISYVFKKRYSIQIYITSLQNFAIMEPLFCFRFVLNFDNLIILIFAKLQNIKM